MRCDSGTGNLFAALGFLTLVAGGCAVSDELDFTDAGVGGMGSGSGGTGQGSGGNTGAAGIVASSAGGSTGTGGIEESGGSTGTGGSGTGGSGTGGAGTTGGGGSTGTGGSAGSSGKGGSTGIGGSGTGASAPTFTQVYTTVLVTYCSGSSCHNPGSQRGVSFASQSTAYAAVKSRVTPGNGAGSSFYQTVNSGSMPPGQKLSTANIALIKSWIDAGALNN